MEEIVVGETIELDVPTGADSIAIYHEWGATVISSDVSGTEFDFVPDSIGVHKVVFFDDEDAPINTSFYSSIVPLISWEQFSDEYEEAGLVEDDFPKIERQVRSLIQNYTNQKFGPYVDKTLEIQGDGGDSLELPLRILALKSIKNNYGDELIDLVEVYPNDPTILQRSSRFRGAHYYEIKRDLGWNAHHIFDQRYIFHILGDWGWEYVPNDVVDAAGLLISDILLHPDYVEMKRRGVFETQLGDFKQRLNADQWGSTGNTTADNILARYVVFGMGMI